MRRFVGIILLSLTGVVLAVAQTNSSSHARLFGYSEQADRGRAGMGKRSFGRFRTRKTFAPL